MTLKKYSINPSLDKKPPTCALKPIVWLIPSPQWICHWISVKASVSVVLKKKITDEISAYLICRFPSPSKETSHSTSGGRPEGTSSQVSDTGYPRMTEKFSKCGPPLNLLKCRMSALARLTESKSACPQDPQVLCMQSTAWEVPFQTKGQQTFSVKDQLVNILGFVGHVVSVTATLLCRCTAKAANKAGVCKLWPMCQI